MKYLVIFLPFLLFADYLEKKSLYELFEEKYYSYICMHRWRFINKYEKKDEKSLSLVAYACLKKHFITPAIDLAKVLRFTKIGRNNATYISTLFLMKNLLIRYVKDDFDEKIELPYIEGDILSDVFYLTFSQKPEVKNDTFWVKDKKFTYKVFVDVEKNNIIIFKFKDKNLISKDLYW